ncbi:MAG: hypothetical protein ACRDJ9_33965, partial [Dehalococcoidia bacterium]
LLAFATAALAAGVIGAGLSALAIWLITVVTGSDAAWSVAPFIIAVAALAVALLTFLAEGVARRRTEEEQRAHGEPWAYRRDQG